MAIDSDCWPNDDFVFGAGNRQKCTLWPKPGERRNNKYYWLQGSDRMWPIAHHYWQQVYFGTEALWTFHYGTLNGTKPTFYQWYEFGQTSGTTTYSLFQFKGDLNQTSFPGMPLATVWRYDTQFGTWSTQTYTLTIDQFDDGWNAQAPILPMITSALFLWPTFQYTPRNPGMRLSENPKNGPPDNDIIWPPIDIPTE